MQISPTRALVCRDVKFELVRVKTDAAVALFSLTVPPQHRERELQGPAVMLNTLGRQ